MFTSVGGGSSSRRRALRGRCLVAVDIENVVGGAVMTARQAERARAAVMEAADLSGSEHIVIGTSHHGLLATGIGWEGPRLVVRSGENGADLALLEVLDQERVEERFDEVVLVSGDGCFSDTAARLGAAGLKVTVVAHPGRCSRRLRMAARHTVYLHVPISELGDAA